MWFQLSPFARTNHCRVWTTPESLGAAPVTVGLTATGSISGTLSQLDWVGIEEFIWDFGDGIITRTTQPTVSHTFGRSGEHTVKLTVRNNVGVTAATRKIYRITSNSDAPQPPLNLRLVNQ
jgi:PKD repeat protein